MGTPPVLWGGQKGAIRDVLIVERIKVMATNHAYRFWVILFYGKLGFLLRIAPFGSPLFASLGLTPFVVFCRFQRAQTEQGGVRTLNERQVKNELLANLDARGVHGNRRGGIFGEGF
jgi:hypothetical protein